MSDDYSQQDFEYMLDGWRAMQQEVIRLREENEKLRKTLIEIQWKTQDVIRPVPFQEEDDEIAAAIRESVDE